MVREELSTEFNKVNDDDSFWKFMDETLGKFVFFKHLPTLDLEDEDYEERLKEFLTSYDKNEKTHFVNSKGRLYVGPMRVL